MKGHGNFLEHLLSLGIFFMLFLARNLFSCYVRKKKEKMQAEKEHMYFPLARKERQVLRSVRNTVGEDDNVSCVHTLGLP